MIRLKGNERLFISEDLIGYSDELVKQGTVPRRVDFLFLGFGYAIKNELQPADDYERHPLISTLSIDSKMMMPIEATAQWYAGKRGYPELTEESELLTLICSIGIAGARELQKRWAVRRKSQIQMDIMQMLSQ